ncbi:transposase [Streptomyces sp. NPDC006544]|uniref:transposase n=1 Tax=Streptomyces sp. NPDC006544 TaxID=3154583 RepID=UPI0033AFDB4A
MLPRKHRRGIVRPAAARERRRPHRERPHHGARPGTRADPRRPHRHGTDILVRTDSAGSAKAFLTHVRDARNQGIRTFFSVGYAVTEPVRHAIRALPDHLWHPALDQYGSPRAGAKVAELTGMVELTAYPAGTRIIVHRERPHPGAQLSLFDQDEGLRHQVFLTDTPYSGGGSAQFLEVRHRGHATVEDHIRCGTTTGFGRFPSRRFAINSAWIELSLAAIDLLAWMRVLLLEGSWGLPSRRSSATDCCTSPPASQRRTATALADIADLALETRTGHGFPPPCRTTPSRRLTGKPLTAHDPKDLGEPDPRAGTPACPSNEVTSPTWQQTISDVSSPQPKRRG